MGKPISAAMVAALALCVATPAAAQEAGDSETTAPAYENTVFDGDWLSIGAGAFYGPSYDGSDDYELNPVPIVQGNLGGIGINPRPAGLALDFLPDADGEVAFNLGVAARVNGNRASRIKDPVVAQYGELKTGVEVGPSVGIKLPAVLNPYDSLSFNADVLWDIAGASHGMTVNPSVTYFTPLSRGIAASLSASTRYVDDDYADYYFSVPLDTTIPAGDRLPQFSAKGGFDKIGLTAFGAFDLDGDVTNGGLAVIVIGGWSRLLGDAKASPFTSIRGSATQWMFGGGVGYTF